MEETFTQSDLVHKLRQLICAHIVCCRQETPPAEKNAALYKAGYLEHELSKALMSLIPIPVSERLPELGHDVLALFTFSDQEQNGGPFWFVSSSYRNGDGPVKWENPFEQPGVLTTVTHWLPLPPKPD